MHKCLYGLAKMLEKWCFGPPGRPPQRGCAIGFNSNLTKITIHPEVIKKGILKNLTRTPHEKVTPKQYLIGALFRNLGQPLGVGQPK